MSALTPSNDSYALGFSDSTDQYVSKTKPGLDSKVVEQISSEKNE